MAEFLRKKIDALKWWTHPKHEENPTDVAVIPVGFKETEDWSFVPLNGKQAMIGTTDVLEERHLGLGDEVFITGLFKSHAGVERNSPIIRIGNVSLMKELIQTTHYGLTEAYLIEARSVGGLSGSPVFIHMPPIQQINGEITPGSGPLFYLLGLMHGHFDIPRLNEDVVREAPENTDQINTGIGIVIPVEKILETIRDNVELADARKKLAGLMHGSATPSPT